MGPGRTPTVHQCPRGKAVIGPQLVPGEDLRQTTTDDDKPWDTCFQKSSAVKRDAQQPGADRHLESCIEAEHSSLKLLVLETGDPRGSRRASYTKTPSTNVEEESRIIKQIAQRNETHHPGED